MLFIVEVDDGLHFIPKPQYIIDKNAIKEFFLFADGVVVFWGINHIEVVYKRRNRSCVLSAFRLSISNYLLYLEFSLSVSFLVHTFSARNCTSLVCF